MRKQETRSFNLKKKTKSQRKYERAPSPQRSETQYDNAENLRVRCLRKDLQVLKPELYVTADLNIDDIIDLKQVFDAYDRNGQGILRPADIKLLMGQNGFDPHQQTVPLIFAEFDEGEAGLLCFKDFIRIMSCRPHKNETKRQLKQVFRKYDIKNKGYIDINDLRKVNKLLKQNQDEETLNQIITKCASNNDGKISFEDFYQVMVKNVY